MTFLSDGNLILDLDLLFLDRGSEIEELGRRHHERHLGKSTRNEKKNVFVLPSRVSLICGGANTIFRAIFSAAADIEPTELGTLVANQPVPFSFVFLFWDNTMALRRRTVIRFALILYLQT